jgi:hypothetical protein
MGKIFNANLSGVSVHTDAEADHIARDAKADATTIDNNIYFKEGAYRPGTSKGNALIAREVAHIQRSKLTGSRGKSSAELDASAQQDAENVGDLVEIMGPNPSQVLRPIDKKPSLIQKRLLQRNGDYSHRRTAGIVTSKVVQGIFTTVLGPIGLLWRWPLIQKNLGEITGWEQFGTRKGKKDADGQLVDKMRYGGTPIGTAMRWLAGISEVLKEFTIWLGFGTFIAAIVAAATHGAAAPVFAGLAIATAITAGLHFLLRSILVGFNTYRLYRAKEQGKDHKIPFIKHQRVSDGVEAISAGLAAVFGALGAGGVSSAGSALASAAGHSGTATAVQAADPTAKLAAFGLGAATQGLGTTVGTNALKEVGKDYVKPDKATKGFKGGFFKDKVEIKGGYNKNAKFKVGSPFKQKAASIDDQFDNSKVDISSQAPQSDKGASLGDQWESSSVDIPSQVPQSADAQQAISMATDIQSASIRNSTDQSEQHGEAQKQAAVVTQLAPQVIKGADDIGNTQQNLKETQAKAEDFEHKIPDLVAETVKGDEGQIDALTAQANIGLDKAQEMKVTTGTPPSSDDQKEVNLARADIRREGGFGSKVSSWFSSKLSGLKAGITRLNNKILKGVMKYASKFNDSEAERKLVASTMNDEKSYMAVEVQKEQENDILFADFQGKAGQLSEGVSTLAEKENA